ncbi:hypothetical protein POM88_000651 [Heracleum sosnowskyi]|uniref:Uncharacterized protein n=1 Tax=Heracleum sosnowskyi TaxID=360622 RepID=A0AAD8JC96_9APIA|nr:hypothetical protein POM88_000651 [Heracleum sosnowskyi]
MLSFLQADQTHGSLKEEPRTILPQLEEMQKRKVERRNQFLDIVQQIQKIRSEIYASDKIHYTSPIVDETDLSLRKLEELQKELQALQREKSDRLKQVLELLSTLNSLCLVLGMDFQNTVNEVHPSLGDSDGTKSINLATTMLELWNLMDTPVEEQQIFQNVTCNIAASEQELKEPNMLSEDFIDYVEGEVFRLEALKASKMKELVFKKSSADKEKYDLILAERCSKDMI